MPKYPQYGPESPQYCTASQLPVNSQIGPRPWSKQRVGRAQKQFGGAIGPNGRKASLSPASPATGYAELLVELKERIRGARIRAGLAVNRER